MKRQIRRNVFETNSSSVHSLTVCTKETFGKWKNDEILFDKWNEEFVDPKELEVLTDKDKENAKNRYYTRKQKYWKDWEDLSIEEKEELYAEEINHKKDYRNLVAYDNYRTNYSLYYYERDYISPSGDELVFFGEYGYDG